MTRLVTTVVGALTRTTCSALVDHIRSLPLRPDAVDCRLVHTMDGFGVEALATLAVATPMPLCTSDAVNDMLENTGLDAAEHCPEEGARWPRITLGTPALHRCAAGIAIHDEDLRYVYVNAALARIDGDTSARHRGRTGPELLRPRPGREWPGSPANTSAEMVVLDRPVLFGPVARDAAQGADTLTWLAGQPTAELGTDELWRWCEHRSGHTPRLLDELPQRRFAGSATG